jgi:predicted nucleotidyltransferase
MISLSSDEQTTLKQVVKTYATDQPYQVYVFGSRATGKAKRYSDIDLALIGQKPVPIRILSSLHEALENSRLPYVVDVVDFQTASQQLREQISTQGVQLASV